jgi:hypothetical protein
MFARLKCLGFLMLNILANEIFYLICEYLSRDQIYDSLFYVSKRFNLLCYPLVFSFVDIKTTRDIYYIIKSPLIGIIYDLF